jgi:hypothetical protein
MDASSEVPVLGRSEGLCHEVSKVLIGRDVWEFDYFSCMEVAAIVVLNVDMFRLYASGTYGNVLQCTG